MTFESTSFKKVSTKSPKQQANKYVLRGNLTIRDGDQAGRVFG